MIAQPVKSTNEKSGSDPSSLRSSDPPGRKTVQKGELAYLSAFHLLTDRVDAVVVGIAGVGLPASLLREVLLAREQDG